jgi:hypothetical protein
LSPSQYPTIAKFRNKSGAEMRLYLEMLGAEVVLGPGHSVELLARPSEGLLPITVDYVDGGLQIHPHKEFDPDWHVRFKGNVIPAGWPTILSKHE